MAIHDDDPDIGEISVSATNDSNWPEPVAQPVTPEPRAAGSPHRESLPSLSAPRLEVPSSLRAGTGGTSIWDSRRAASSCRCLRRLRGTAAVSSQSLDTANPTRGATTMGIRLDKRRLRASNM